MTFLVVYVLIIAIDCYFRLQAAYFVSQGFRRKDKRSNMLLVSAKLYQFSPDFLRIDSVEMQ